MARTGKWPARISLALSIAMIGALFSVISASGQQTAGAGIPTVGIEVQSASITQATYALVVRNQGDAPSTGIRVRAKVPTGTTFESSDPAPVTTTSPGSPAQSCANGGVREPADTTCEWSIGTLNPGEVRTITAVFNLLQSNSPSDRIDITATVTDNEQRSNSDTDESLVRQRVTVTEDTWVDDSEPPNWNHGICPDLRVLQGNRITSYIDIDSLGTAPNAADNPETSNSMETFYGAQLRLEVLDTTYTPGAPGIVGARRITSPDWTEGGGDCQGSASTVNTDARTNGEPSSAAAPTGTTPVSSAAQVVNIDVTGDLDTESDRGTFQGWELRDEATSGADNLTRFHSAETTTGQAPQVFLVYTTVETATCIDGDPEAGTATVGSEHLMTAFVTDGDKIPTGGTTPGSGTGPGGDACDGGPVAAAVEWFIEDDIPDIYFSSQEGQPIQKTVASDDAGPDAIETGSDTNGVTSAGVRLDNPPDTADTTNRIEVRIKGAAGDPDPPPPAQPDPAQGTCGAVTIPEDKNCSGESDQFDDVTVTWAAQSSGASSATTSTTTSSASTSASTSASGSTSPSTSGSTSPSTSGSTSPSTISPTSSASTTAGTTGSSSSAAQSSRTVSLFADTNEVVYPGQVTLSGRIISPDPSCDDAGEFIRIRQRLFGESEYSDYESRSTDAEGDFEATFEATESAEYIAVAPPHDQCAEAVSSSETVLVKVKVTARANRRSVTRGGTVVITGRVQPDHDGTQVILQRKKGRRFVAIGRVDLDVSSRFRFGIDAKWRGRRTFRVVWKSQDDDHEGNKSANMVVRTRRG